MTVSLVSCCCGLRGIVILACLSTVIGFQPSFPYRAASYQCTLPRERRVFMNRIDDDDVDNARKGGLIVESATGSTTASDDTARTATTDAVASLPNQQRRRQLLLWSTMATLSALQSTTMPVTMAMAEPNVIASSALPSAATATNKPPLMLPEQAVVTDKVFFNVRISRSDGTFYVRDDLPNTIDNQVFTGRLVIGLFGKNAPNHVARFLQYVDVNSKPLDEAPLPSYSRSSFVQFDQASGLLYGGSIPSLEVTELQGMSAIKYGGRLLPAKLWIDVATPTSAPKLSHIGVGLLTHEQFDVTPAFAITTRTDTAYLDRTHTVFGQLLRDDTSTAFLQRVAELPTYSVDRRVVASSSSNGNSKDSKDNELLDQAERAIFAAQRDFFRGAAQSLGDTRVSKLYDGKLLRRVEVTQVGLL